MEATPLCLLLHQLHLLSRTQHRFILIQIVPLHMRHTFRPVLGKPSSGMSKQKSYKGRYNKIQGDPRLQSLFFIMLKQNIQNKSIEPK